MNVYYVLLNYTLCNNVVKYIESKATHEKKHGGVVDCIIKYCTVVYK
jgi:hypothetical protein